MDGATKNLVKYVEEKGISVAAISKNTGFSPGVLYPSFKNKRALRADEFLAICSFLEKNPLDFKKNHPIRR